MFSRWLHSNDLLLHLNNMYLIVFRFSFKNNNLIINSYMGNKEMILWFIAGT